MFALLRNWAWLLEYNINNKTRISWLLYKFAGNSSLSTFDRCIPLQFRTKENNQTGTANTFYVCPQNASTSHLCNYVKQPFDTWYQEIRIFKNYCGKENENCTTENTTQITHCDDTWQSPFLKRFGGCRYLSGKQRRIKGSGYLISPVSFVIVSWIMAFFACVGNVIVFFASICSLWKNYRSMSEVQKTQNFLLVNLAVADFLMGIYLMTVSIFASIFSGSDGRAHLIHNATFLCTLLGVIIVVSSQVSVSILVIITSFRLHSILRPYKSANLKVAMVLTILSWIAWALFACIPIINVEGFGTLFERVVDDQCPRSKPKTHSYRNIRGFTTSFAKMIFEKCNGETDLVIADMISRPQILAMAQHVKLVNSEILHLNYYGPQKLCNPKYFVKGSADSKIYSLIMVMFNFAAVLYLLAAYLLICFKARGDWRGFICFDRSANNVEVGLREKENRRLQRKVFFIVVTDFLCWAPTTFVSIWYVIFTSDLYDPDVCKVTGSLRLPLSILTTILIPINSSINPLLYYSLPSVLHKFIPCRRRQVSSRESS